MVMRRLFGSGDDDPENTQEGPVTIRIEVDGKTYIQRYTDLAMAQLRFPQYLADIAAVHGSPETNRDS
jgi:hypothetical protein